MDKNISFVHFNGYLSEWESRLLSNIYDNCIVFAKVWQPDRKCAFKIYAGKDKNGANYLYNIDTFSDIIKIEEELNNLKNLVNIDDENKFTSDVFKNAIDNYLNDSPIISNIRTDITNILQAITWYDENNQKI